MVQPFDYSIRSTAQGPLQALSQGMQLGQQFAQIAEQREAQRLRQQMEQEKLRQAQEAAAAEQAARGVYFSDPSPTNALRWQATLTADMAKALNPGIEALSRDQLTTLNTNGLRDYALLTSGRADMVMSDLQAQARARREANDEPGARRLEDVAEVVRVSPQAVASTLLAQVASRPGGAELVAKFNEARKLNLEQREKFETLTAQQATNLGLPSGNTYQRNKETGKIETLTTAGKSFEVVSRAEVEKLGLPAGAYKREIGTGEISAIGPGGTNITLKTEGSIPEGYRAIRDSQGNLMSYEPVPGSPAAAKAQAEVTAQQARAEGKTQQAGIVSQDIQRLVAALDSEESLSGAARLDPRNYVTGIPGKAAEKLPGSARIAAQGFVDSIKASIGFDRLDQMRQESPTGGALGNITEQELRFLQATLGSIDLDSKPEVLRQNLRRLQTIYENIMRKAAEYPNAAKFGFTAATQGQVGGAIAQPAPGGAVMEPVVRTLAPSALPVRPPSPAGAAAATPVPAGNVATPVTTSPAARPPIQVPPLPPTRDYGAGTRVSPTAPGGKDIGGGFRVLD